MSSKVEFVFIFLLLSRHWGQPTAISLHELNPLQNENIYVWLQGDWVVCIAQLSELSSISKDSPSTSCYWRGKEHPISSINDCISTYLIQTPATVIPLWNARLPMYILLSHDPQRWFSCGPRLTFYGMPWESFLQNIYRFCI